MNVATLPLKTLIDCAGWAAFAASAIGLVRRRNEDDLVFLPSVASYAVCDGMGGHPGGAEASAAACAAAEAFLLGPEEDLPGAAAAAAKAVHAAAAENPALADMGTTMTLVRLDAAAGRARVAHVGDSRLYRSSDSGLSQITTDHTMGAELVRGGRLTEAEARQNHSWHRLTRVIGCGDPTATAEVVSFALSDSRVILLCTDGVSNMIPDRDMAHILNRAAPDPRAACTALVDTALAAGGTDNATAIVLCPAQP